MVPPFNNEALALPVRFGGRFEPERVGQEPAQPVRFVRDARVERAAEDGGVVGHELGQHLAASAAGQDRVRPASHDRHRHDLQFAGAGHLGHTDSHALGADGEPVGGVLDVRAGEDAAVRELHRRPHPEAGEGAVREGRRVTGLLQQLFDLRGSERAHFRSFLGGANPSLVLALYKTIIEHDESQRPGRV